jgi:hypothetical protein
MSQAAMSDPAVPAPPLAAAVSATERQAGGAPQTPARLPFACNPLIFLDRAENEFPNIAMPKGVSDGGAPRTPRGFLLPATL